MEEHDLSKIEVEEPVGEDSPVAEGVDLGEEEIPCRSSPEWSDYVLRQFEQDEVDPQGNPTTQGLRRVVEKVMGEIVYSMPRTIQAPNILNDHHAVVEYEIRIMHGDTLKVYGEVADVWVGNTDEEFRKYAPSTAATRAEGRALRKALQLKRVIASEESSASELKMPEKITSGQINFIDMMCSKNNINVFKLINASKNNKYERIEDVPYGTAVQINKYLSEVQNGKRKANQDLMGYDETWRNVNA